MFILWLLLFAWIIALVMLFFKTVIAIFIRCGPKYFKHSHSFYKYKTSSGVLQPVSLDTEQFHFEGSVCTYRSPPHASPASVASVVSPASFWVQGNTKPTSDLHIKHQASSIRTKTIAMDSTTGITGDKNKKDYAAAVRTTMEHGPPPSASLYPSHPVGIGKVRCSFFLYRLICVARF
jgi:hypothetical protein